MNPGVVPMVLVQVRRRTPSDDGQLDLGGLSGGEIAGDIELVRQPRVGPHPDRFAIYRHVQHRLGTGHVQHDAPICPLFGYLDLAAIHPGRVDLRNSRRRTGEWHLDIGVLGNVPYVLHRPAPGHLHGGDGSGEPPGLSYSVNDHGPSRDSVALGSRANGEIIARR